MKDGGTRELEKKLEELEKKLEELEKKLEELKKKLEELKNVDAIKELDTSSINKYQY